MLSQHLKARSANSGPSSIESGDRDPTRAPTSNFRPSPGPRYAGAGGPRSGRWQHQGVGFRRQVRLGSYIVDFLAPSVRLIIEVDGGYHQGRRNADARRDRWLRRQGYTVLRLPAAMVLEDLAGAVQAVRIRL